VRAQLQRLLDHPLFTHSKRYPVLLAYTVEQTLLGNSSALKERTIGIEAFGRKPDYDANADPVVRTTAAEVRKRLIQYYYDASHAGQLIIEFTPGSYIPAFRLGSTAFEQAPVESPSDLAIAATQVEAKGPVLAFQMPAARVETQSVPARKFGWLMAGVCSVVAVLVGFGLGQLRLFQNPSNLDRFWEPVTASSSPTTYCVGEPYQPTVSQVARRSAASEDELQTRLYFSGRMNISDVVTLTHTTAPLASHHGSFRVLPASEATFAQLREGPIVLIGAFDNPWTLRITEGLHYGFATEDGVWRITDRRSKQPTPWFVQMDQPIQSLTQDYAIVARIRDTMTGQPVIIVAGLSDQGTEAASEVVYNPVYLDSLLAKAPKDWSSRNLEAVIQTHVIQGHPGPPDILAVDAW